MPLSDTYISYGSSTDLWGETWANTDINDIDFGVVLSLNMGARTTAFIDHIRITVSYTAPSSRVSIKGGRIQIKGGTLKIK